MDNVPLPPPRPPNLEGAAGAPTVGGSVKAGAVATITTKSGPDNLGSLPMLRAISDVLAGGALQVPAEFTSTVNALQSATNVFGALNKVVRAATVGVALYSYAKNNMAGAALMVGAGVVGVVAKNAGIDENNVLFSALKRANQLFTDPLTFLQTCSRTQSNAEASFLSGGHATLLGAFGSLNGLLVGCRTLTDLVTGGITASVGPGATNTIAYQRITAQGLDISANDIILGLQAVAQALRGFGRLWDPSDPTKLGTAIGMIEQLRNIGTADRISLDFYLAKAGLDVNHIDQYLESDLEGGLSYVQGSQLAQVIRETYVTVYASSDRVTSLKDLLDPYVILPPAAIDHIPGADMPTFGRAIASWGITNTVTWLDIGNLLAGLDIPDCPDINKVNLPSDYANLKPYLTSGSGLFGQAMVKDFIGTAAGATHQEATRTLLDASQTVQQSAEGKALYAAIIAYDNALTATIEGQNVFAAENALNALDVTSPSYPNDIKNKQSDLANAQLALDNAILAGSGLSPSYLYSIILNDADVMLACMQAVVNSPNPQVQQALAKSNTATLDSAIQMVNEIQNGIIMASSVLSAVQQLAAGAAALSAASPVGVNFAESLGLSKLITQIEKGDLMAGITGAFDAISGVIKSIGDYSGLSDLVESMTTSDPAGQNMRAMFADARNRSLLGRVGVSNTRGTVNVEDAARTLRARTGYGLTGDQIRRITEDANYRGLNVGDQLAINSLYGYNKTYYEHLVF